MVAAAGYEFASNLSNLPSKPAKPVPPLPRQPLNITNKSVDPAKPVVHGFETTVQKKTPSAYAPVLTPQIPKFFNAHMTGPIVTLPDSDDQLVPIRQAPLPVVPVAGSGFSNKVCSAAVAAATAAGLPPQFAGAAHQLCVEYLPSAYQLGYQTIKSAKRYLTRVIEDKFMAKGKNKGVKALKGAKSSAYSMQRVTGAPSGGARNMARVEAPVAVTLKVNRRSKPKMRVVGDAVVIQHSEMISSVVSGAFTNNISAFSCTGFRANPGVASVFPWLSSVAVNYEKYRFRRLSFTIVPLVSTSYSGRIGVGFDYDSSDSVPGSRQEFYALTTHAENMPWEAASILVKCDTAYKFTGTHTTADSKLIDQGQVILMSDSISNGGTLTSPIALYDVIVDYEVELIEPQQALFATQIFAKRGNFVANTNLGQGTDTTTIAGPQNCESAMCLTNSVVSFAVPAGNYFVSGYYSWASGTPTFTLAGTGNIKANAVVSGSTVQVTGVVQSSVDFTINLNLGGVTWNANLNLFNTAISRIPTSVYNAYLNA